MDTSDTDKVVAAILSAGLLASDVANGDGIAAAVARIGSTEKAVSTYHSILKALREHAAAQTAAEVSS